MIINIPEATKRQTGATIHFFTKKKEKVVTCFLFHLVVPLVVLKRTSMSPSCLVSWGQFTLWWGTVYTAGRRTGGWGTVYTTGRRDGGAGCIGSGRQPSAFQGPWLGPVPILPFFLPTEETSLTTSATSVAIKSQLSRELLSFSYHIDLLIYFPQSGWGALLASSHSGNFPGSFLRDVRAPAKALCCPLVLHIFGFSFYRVG